MKTRSRSSLGTTDLPNCPALYALCGGTGRRTYVAYVGITDSLKRRAGQHLVTRDSSIATSTSAVGLNPDYVTELRWWEDRRFSRSAAREAAELVAFDVLEPALRSRGHISKAAKKLYGNSRFRREMKGLIEREPTGCLRLLSREELARKLAKLEDRIEKIEERLKER